MTQTPSTAVQPVTSAKAAEKLVQQIASLAGGGDHYTATRLERDLWEGALEAIAASNAQAGYIAAAALESKKIDFPRTAIV